MKLYQELINVRMMVHQFHSKHGIGISVQSQNEMYSRCTLLFEELGELITALQKETNIAEELADVYYVLIGNLVSMGYTVRTETFQPEAQDCSDPVSSLIVSCSKIAQKVRKNWEPKDKHFETEFVSIHASAIAHLYRIATTVGIYRLGDAIRSKHERLMNRSSRLVGTTNVVSEWA